MASFLYNSAKKKILQGLIDLDTDTIKCMLCTATYTPNRDTHDFRDDVTNEVSDSGTGYTLGGATLANKAINQDDTLDRAALDADDVSWAASTITARYAVLYKSRGGASSADELIALIDFGTDKSSSASNFDIIWDSVGIFFI